MKKKNICSRSSRYLDSLDSLPWTAVVLIVLNRLDGRNGLTARRVYSESLRQMFLIDNQIRLKEKENCFVRDKTQIETLSQFAIYVI